MGILKQAFMKIQSFVDDIDEASEDNDLTEDEKYEFKQMVEIGTLMAMRILTIVEQEMSEDEFLNIDIPMDEIEEYPYKPMEEE